jgi:predicted anti-sigma-YlaC factor YlaD
MGLSPYLSLTAAFVAVWLSKSRGLQMILIVLYTLLGLFAIAAGIAAWSHTGNILTLIMFPVILIVSLPSFIILRKQ